MNFVAIFFIGVGLAMDAFTVSISCGINQKKLELMHATRIALFFGVAQAVMPVLGWLIGLKIQHWISAFDHWIAFALLGFIGGKMLWEARDHCICKTDYLNIRVLFTLALATSIDAFAVGLSFAVLGETIVTPAIIIGVITFMMSLGGVYLGDRIGCLLGKKMEIAGGLILIGIGAKILIEHLIKGI